MTEIEELLAEIEYWYQLYAVEVSRRTLGGTPMALTDSWENRLILGPPPGAPTA